MANATAAVVLITLIVVGGAAAAYYYTAFITPSGTTSSMPTASSSTGRTFHVPSEYPTIDAAITATEPGDAVVVASGNYSGFVVDRAITVEAAGNGVLVEGITVHTTGATVKGFTVYPTVAFRAPEFGVQGPVGEGSGCGAPPCTQSSCAAILVEAPYQTGSNDTIENNTITNPPSSAGSSCYGIFVQGGGVEVAHNIVIGMFGGIADDQGTRNYVHGNVLNDSREFGIWLFASGDEVYDNVVTGSGQVGIWADYGIAAIGFTPGGNQIHFNQIGGTTLGVWTESQNNVVVSNNFVNGSSARDDASGNSWSLNAEGNYWSDWNTPNLPYPIPGSARSSDQYPLVNPVTIPSD